MREVQTLDGRRAYVSESIVTFFPLDQRFKLGRLDLENLIKAMEEEEKNWEKKHGR